MSDIVWGAPRDDRYRLGPLAPCVIVGCDRPRSQRGLCSLHADRLRDGRPLILAADEVGVRPSGVGVYGVLLTDGEQVMCHECGRWMTQITAGHLRSHGLTATVYRERHGLGARERLCSPAYGARRSQIIREHPHVIDAGKAALREHGEMGTVAAAEALRARGGRATTAQVRARTEGVRRSITDRRDAGELDHPCSECGQPVGRDRRGKVRATCSLTCRAAAIRRGSWVRSARAAGEELDFERRAGSGRRVMATDLAAILGVDASHVISLARRGIGLPQWNGRVAGEPYWWESSLVAHAVQRRDDVHQGLVAWLRRTR